MTGPVAAESFHPGTPTAGGEWLSQAFAHLDARRWGSLVRQCEAPELPAAVERTAGLLAVTAAAYLAQPQRMESRIGAAISAGTDRRALIASLMAAAHSHLQAAIRHAGGQDHPFDAGFHCEREAHALAIVMASARDASVARPRPPSPSAQIKALRALVDELRREVHGLRASSRADASTHPLLAQVREGRLTYLSVPKLASLARTCQAIEEQRIPGRFIEAGCALGGSAIVIGALKRRDRPFDVHDVFGMIPPPTDDDPPEVHQRYLDISQGKAMGLGGDRYYGYELDLQAIVTSNLERFGLDLATDNILLVRGLVQDTLIGRDAVALAHLDVDWYEPTRYCLQQLYPRLSCGGSIIVDDYRDWGGCRRAVDEFLGSIGDAVVGDDAAGSMKITKVRPS